MARLKMEEEEDEVDQYSMSLVHMEEFLKENGIEKDSTELVNGFYKSMGMMG